MTLKIHTLILFLIICNCQHFFFRLFSIPVLLWIYACFVTYVILCFLRFSCLNFVLSALKFFPLYITNLSISLSFTKLTIAKQEHQPKCSCYDLKLPHQSEFQYSCHVLCITDHGKWVTEILMNIGILEYSFKK